MNSRQRRTHQRIFERPTRSDLKWTAVVSLLKALGAEISEADGARVRVLLSERIAIFHRPHPAPEAGKGLIEALRKYLENAGMQP